MEADTPLILTGAARIWVADPDAGDELVRLWLSSGLGTLTLSSTSGLEFLDGSNGWSSMIFDGNLTDVNAALDGMVFQPDLGSSGTGYFWFYVDDLGHSGGPAQQGDFYVELDIGEWNSPPAVSAPDQVYTLAGVPIRFSAEANTDIRVSDRDAGDEPIEMSLECEWGTLTLSTTAGLTFTRGMARPTTGWRSKAAFPPSMPHWTGCSSCRIPSSPAGLTCKATSTTSDTRGEPQEAWFGFSIEVCAVQPLAPSLSLYPSRVNLEYSADGGGTLGIGGGRPRLRPASDGGRIPGRCPVPPYPATST